jgi:chaperone required for assembly of F1-ATPase
MTTATDPRRFYKTAGTQPVEGGFAISLDGRIPKSPAKHPLILPNLASAELVATEWSQQGDVIVPASMPMTRLVNVVLDRGEATRSAMIDEVVRYARTDLVCYRVPSPKTLVEAQALAWDPILVWARANYDIALDITYDALAIAQPTIWRRETSGP